MQKLRGRERGGYSRCQRSVQVQIMAVLLYYSSVLLGNRDTIVTDNVSRKCIQLQLLTDHFAQLDLQKDLLWSYAEHTAAR